MANGHRALSLVSSLQPPRCRPRGRCPGENWTGRGGHRLPALRGRVRIPGRQACPRDQSGGWQRVARLYELQMAHAGETDFASVARAHGQTALRRFFTLDFYRAHGPGAGEAALDEAVEEVLEILGRVTAFERAMAN